MNAVRCCGRSPFVDLDRLVVVCTVALGHRREHGDLQSVVNVKDACGRCPLRIQNDRQNDRNLHERNEQAQPADVQHVGFSTTCRGGRRRARSKKKKKKKKKKKNRADRSPEKDFTRRFSKTATRKRDDLEKNKCRAAGLFGCQSSHRPLGDPERNDKLNLPTSARRVPHYLSWRGGARVRAAGRVRVRRAVTITADAYSRA